MLTGKIKQKEQVGGVGHLHGLIHRKLPQTGWWRQGGEAKTVLRLKPGMESKKKNSTIERPRDVSKGSARLVFRVSANYQIVSRQSREAGTQKSMQES